MTHTPIPLTLIETQFENKMLAKKDPTEKIAVIYCRVSTEGQNRPDFSSLDTQEERCRAWCKLNDYLVYACYKDVESGGTIKRPRFQEMLQDAQSQKFNTIIITKIDRFSRSISDYHRVLSEIDPQGIGIVAIDQPAFSTGGPSGKLMRNVLLATAEFERDMIRQRTAEGMRAKINRGEWHGSPIPFGYNLANKHLHINEAEASLIQRIYREYLDGKSSKELTLMLNKEGYRTKKGLEFNDQQILRILSNPIYYGKIAHNRDGEKILIDGKHPPIIDAELFEKAQAMRESHQVNAYTDKVMPNFHLFGSLLKCGHCKTAMTPSFVEREKARYYYYRCVNALKRDNSACPIKQVNSADIEAISLSLMRLLAQNDSLVRAVVQEVAEMDKSVYDAMLVKRKRLGERRAEEKRRETQLLNALESPGASEVKVIVDRLLDKQKVIDELSGEMERLESQIKAFTPEKVSPEAIKGRLMTFFELWENLSITERTKTIRAQVKELRLFREADDRFRLEIELRRSGQNEAPTGKRRGSFRNSGEIGSA